MVFVDIFRLFFLSMCVRFSLPTKRIPIVHKTRTTLRFFFLLRNLFIDDAMEAFSLFFFLSTTFTIILKKVASDGQF